MQTEINNFIDYLTHNYINYISSVHNFVPVEYVSSFVGEFGGKTKYARILICIKKKTLLENYYNKNLKKEINLDIVKKQIRYSFILAKESNLFTPDQFNHLIENFLDSYYTTPMYRVESLFKNCIFSHHKDTSIGDEFVPLNYREYSEIVNPLRGNNDDLIKVAYVNYVSKWPDQDIEYIHSFVALENSEAVDTGDILAVKDFDRPDKTKIVGNVNRPTTYLDVGWKTIK